MVLVVGGRDHLVNADEVLEYGPRISGVRIEQFERSGHALFLEEHERFTALVRELTARRLPAPATRAGTRRPRTLP